MRAFVVHLIRQSPERYIVFWEAVYESDKQIAQHINDDWDAVLVDREFAIEGSFFMCLRHGRKGCSCIDEVQRHRDDAGLTDNNKV